MTVRLELHIVIRLLSRSRSRSRRMNLENVNFATSNVEDESSSHNGSTSNQMARVKQKNDSQEPAPECSTACSPTDDDFSQQHYLIPGYNLIFIKEEEYGEIRVIISFIFIHQ
ncbi:uncharacterized protein LOC111057599 [Nilaparvata lugens]|uniref:uncharacterized protein LOC111057599 n=1 Tax=Nilaparvata lugens TaxID=108931 RepID=UPI00193EB0D3|nr:uncharacterized protein LOC111057599 [Nilaparvata lugens]